MSYLMNHELVHVMTSDRPAPRDRFFRQLFRGKVAPVAEHPESVPYLYLTAPRRASPRWYWKASPCSSIPGWPAVWAARRGRSTRWCSARWSTAAASPTRSGSRRN